MQFAVRLFWLLYTTSIALCHTANRDYLSRGFPESAYREREQYTDLKLLTDKLRRLACNDMICAEEQSNILSNTQSENQEIMSMMKFKHSNQGHKQHQWHNYPRQLDRLQSFYEKRKKNNPGDSSNYEETISIYPYFDYIGHEQRVRSPLQPRNTNSISERLIQILPQASTFSRYEGLMYKGPVTKFSSELEKQMNYLNNGLDERAGDPRKLSVDEGSGLSFKLSNDNGLDAEAPIILQDERDKNDRLGLNDNEHKRISKRVFSLWSRMQGMKPTIREVIHRRYYHSYNPPRVFRGDMLTAETRAFMRPAGSPLRWG